MLEDWTTVAVVIAVIFLATVIRSAFGFGEALIAVPLLALRIPVETAVPLAALASITVALIVVIQDWRKIHFRTAAWLVAATLFGIPLGLLLLAAAAEAVVKGILAGIILAFSSYCIIKRAPLELKNDRFAWIFGLAAGVLGGAYGMNGPPLVVYGTLRRWSPEHFRATLQGYFLPASIVGMAGYALAGLWTVEVSECYLLALPAILAAIFAGRLIHRRVHGNRFLLFIHLGLIGVGLILLIQAFWPSFHERPGPGDVALPGQSQPGFGQTHAQPARVGN